MNRVKPSSDAQTKKIPAPHPPPEKKERNLKRERLPAKPLRGFSKISYGSSTCSNSSNGSSSVSTSGESSNGGHKFLLSHSLSSSSSSSSSSSLGPVRSVAKTPKSAPVFSKPLIRKKPRLVEEIKLKSAVNDKPQRSKTNPSSRKRVTGKVITEPEKGSVLKKQSSVYREVKLKESQTVTPVSKLGTGSGLIYISNGEATDDGRLSSNSNSSCREKTPPVQASLSPEMHCGSSMNVSASTLSQACYAAGHLLSGVSDKRKCKPKGILTVFENGFEVGKVKKLHDFDEFDDGDYCNGASCNNGSVMPLPADASVQWLLSPCEEEKEHEKEEYDHGFSPSPLSDRSASSDLCNISSGKSLSPMNVREETRRPVSASLSPHELSRFRRFVHLTSPLDTIPTCELDPSEYLKGDKLSPLSLGSENVIQTPESNSSFDSYFGLSCSQGEIQKKHDVGSVLESLTTSLQSARLSPRSHVSPQEPSSSSFNFGSLAISSDSIDLSQFQRGLVDMSSHHSLVTRGRVSWRGEANSHLHELDTRNNREDAAPAGKGRELLPLSVAESINIDGGGLICSEDSNWMACYKN
ncbi:unnamed protein product [Cochlearia groenlandica]